jgi:riboflavin kinase/FMN adenylyltransferase
MSPQDFTERVLVEGLHVKWLMVGDDFCYGAGAPAMSRCWPKRASATASRSTPCRPCAKAPAHLVLRRAQCAGCRRFRRDRRPARPPVCDVRPRDPRRQAGPHARLSDAEPARGAPPCPAGIFVVQVHGLADHPLPAVASLGVRPTVEDAGRMLLEVHIFDYDRPATASWCASNSWKSCATRKNTSTSTLTAAIDRDAARPAPGSRPPAAHDPAARRAGALTATDRI